MTLVPRSFFGRNVLLLMSLFAFGLGCGVLALREWTQKPRITEIAALVAQQMRLAQLALEVVPEERRESTRAWLNLHSSIQALPLSAADPPPVAPHPYPAVRQFIEDLRLNLPAARDVRWAARSQGSVWVQMSIERHPYWFMEEGVFLGPSISATSLGTFVLVAALSVFGAVRIQRRINRPLARLVASAGALQSNQRMAPLDEGGPEEFAVVSRAFNQMTASLERMDAERAVLLAGVSHDLRTPLAKMRLAIEMLRGSADPELVQSMQRSASEMETVTDQFLYYARDRDDPSDLVDANLSELVLDSVDRHRGGSRAIFFQPAEECFVAVHRDSISRAVDNLIENALRYGESDVEVVLCVRDGCARISVLDRGPGIPPSEIATVKKPFARGSSGAGKAGAGLGLAIVERIATSHGARFDLLPRAGGGTEARLELAVPSAAPVGLSREAGTAHAQ